MFFGRFFEGVLFGKGKEKKKRIFVLNNVAAIYKSLRTVWTKKRSEEQEERKGNQRPHLENTDSCEDDTILNMMDADSAVSSPILHWPSLSAQIFLSEYVVTGTSYPLHRRKSRVWRQEHYYKQKSLSRTSSALSTPPAEPELDIEEFLEGMDLTEVRSTETQHLSRHSNSQELLHVPPPGGKRGDGTLLRLRSSHFREGSSPEQHNATCNNTSDASVPTPVTYFDSEAPEIGDGGSSLGAPTRNNRQHKDDA